MQEVKSGLRYFFKQPVKRQGVKSVAAPSNSAGLPQRCQQLLHADTKAERQRFQEEGLGLGAVQYVQEQLSPAKLNSFGYPLHELDSGASAPLQSLWHTGSGSCGWRQHICGDSSEEFCAKQQEGNPERKYGQDQKSQPMSGYRVGYDDQFDLQAAEPPIPHPLPVCHSNEGRG